MKNPSFLFFGPFENKIEWSNFLAPPLGVHRVASYLRNHGYGAEVVDPDLERITEKKFERFVRGRQYDFIGISPTHITLENDLGLAYLAKKYSPQSIILAGGPEATFAHDLVMDNSPIDVVVLGEGEKPSLGLANAERKGRLEERFGNIEGLIIQGEKSRIKTGFNKALNKEEFLEATMGMDFSKIPYERYWGLMENFYKGDLENPQTRARRQQEIYSIRFFQANYCPYHCTFCGSRDFQNNASGGTRTKIVSLSAEKLVELIEKGYSAYPKIQTIIFQDDNFMVGLRDNKVEKLLEILNSKKESGKLPPNLSFIAQSRVDNVNPERLNMLKKANFRVISYGVESFSQRMLDEVRKEITVERAERTLVETLAVGIKPYLNIILSAPNSDFYDVFETINKSVNYISMGAEAGSYNTIIPLPGSEIERIYRGSDLVDFHNRKIAFTDKVLRKAERILPVNLELREMIYRFDEVIDKKKEEFMDASNLRYQPKTKYVVSAKATRVNTLIRFATLYELAKEMKIKPYGEMADKEIPRIKGLLPKF